MNNYTLFENTVYKKRLEVSFYRYCMLRQISLIRFLPLYFLWSILYFFKAASRKKYLAVRYSFLGYVRDVEKKAASFAAKNKKRLYYAFEPMIVLSEHPGLLVGELCCDECEVIANEYDLTENCFADFVPASQMVPDDEYMATGTPASPIMKHAANRCYLYNKSILPTALSYGVTWVMHRVLTILSLGIFAVVIACISMYFAALPMEKTAELFITFFDKPIIAILNITPVLFVIYLLYFITNSAWISALITGGLTMVLTWVNYFKLMFRNDPFILEDLTIIMEAKAMTEGENYKITLNAPIILTILGILFFTAVCFLAFNAKVRSFGLRFIAVILLLIFGSVGLNKYLLDPVLYESIENFEYINQWSATELYISRGFIYPFIQSYNTARDIPPEGYDEAEAQRILSGYEYSSIPEDKKVNVMSIMLEAFADFSRFDQVKFGTDPYEGWHELEAESYHGALTPDVFAASTIVTERSFLTGYTGRELPSFRKNTNSYVWYFKEQGYNTMGCHPCFNWFYNRINCNKNLGFDNYYFDEDTFKELNGGGNKANNDVMFPKMLELFYDQIDDGEHCFSFNVTYQGHGQYWNGREYAIDYAANYDLPEGDFHVLNNYLGRMAQTSKDVVWLRDELAKREEPIVLILFGDHMPWLGNNAYIYNSLGINIDVSTEEGFNNYYQTPYLIWANDAAKAVLGNDFTGEGPKVGSYHLMSTFFDLAGYGGNEYMQYSRQVRDVMPVTHWNGLYYENGAFTTILTDSDKALLDEFKRIQYYQRNNFKG